MSDNIIVPFSNITKSVIKMRNHLYVFWGTALAQGASELLAENHEINTKIHNVRPVFFDN